MKTKLYNLDVWVFNRVKFFSDQGKECFESNATMAKNFDRHPNRISASVSKLLKAGYIVNKGESRFDRRLVLAQGVNNLGEGVNTITCQHINKDGEGINNLGATINNLGVDELTIMLKGINKNGVEVLTNAVIGLNKSSDIIKTLTKTLNIDFNSSLCPPEGDEADETKLIRKSVKDYWNTHVASYRVSEIRSITDQRMKSLKARIKAAGGLEEFLCVLARISRSSFLTGKKTDWACTFDWVLKPDNFNKILEGQYDDKSAPHHAEQKPTYQSASGRRKQSSDSALESLARKRGWLDNGMAADGRTAKGGLFEKDGDISDATIIDITNDG